MRGPGTFLTRALPSSTVVEGCHLPMHDSRIPQRLCCTIIYFRRVKL